MALLQGPFPPLFGVHAPPISLLGPHTPSSSSGTSPWLHSPLRLLPTVLRAGALPQLHFPPPDLPPRPLLPETLSPEHTTGTPSPDSILGVPHPVLSTQGPPAPALLTRTPPPLNLTAESAAPHPLRRGPRCPDLTTQGPHPTLSTQGTPGPPFPLRSPHLPTSLLRDPRPFLTPAKPGLLTRRRPRWWGTGPRRWRG